MIFKSIFGGGKKGPANLPALNAFVDVVVAGRSARSVTVEAIDGRTIAVKDVVGRAGENAAFVYATEHGKYRFSTRVRSAGDGHTVFDLPGKIDHVGGANRGAGTGGAQKRSSVRLDAIVPGQWRFAPQGKGIGNFVRANIRDISRGGCSMICDRVLKHGTTIEVRLQLQSDRPQLSVVGEVMRHEAIAASGRHSHGLRFHGVSPEEDQAIRDFINRKQADLRNRGLA